MSANDTRTEGRVTASVERLRRELDHWLEMAFAQGGKALDKMGLRGHGPWVPLVDIVETLDEVHVYADLPGIDPASVEVTIAGNMLTLKGESPERSVEKTDCVHVRERPHGPFSRSIPMPVPVDSEAVSAEAKEGVLHIRLGKAERARARQIQINAEPGPPGASI